jgi:hypothetical protein
VVRTTSAAPASGAWTGGPLPTEITESPAASSPPPSAKPVAAAHIDSTSPVTRILQVALVVALLLGAAGGLGLYLTRQGPGRHG